MVSAHIARTGLAETVRSMGAPGVCSSGPHSAWVIGRWRVDDDVLEFASLGARPSRLVVPLHQVCRVDVRQRRYLLTTKRVLEITYRPARLVRPRRVWLLTGDLRPWESELAPLDRRARGVDRAGPSTRLASLTRALEVTGESTGRVLDVLAGGTPVTSGDLAELLDVHAPDAGALTRGIAAHFGHIAAALGAPALHYVDRRLHLPTATMYRQSWWLDDRVAAAWHALCAPVEVHVGDASVTVITAAPPGAGNAAPSVHVEADGRALVVSAGPGYERRVALPVPVHLDTMVTQRVTGVVVIDASRVVRVGRAGSPAAKGGHDG